MPQLFGPFETAGEWSDHVIGRRQDSSDTNDSADTD